MIGPRQRPKRWLHKWRKPPTPRCECWMLFDRSPSRCSLDAWAMHLGRRVCWTHFQIIKEGRYVEFVEGARA